MGKVSEITGNAYGAGGAAGDGTTAGSATANTGNGGKGGRNSSNSTYRKGGNGGSGIVVVRLKEAYARADATLTDLSLAQSETVSSFADASTGSAVEIRYGQVGEMSFSVANVARAERTKDGAFAIVGMQPGTTRATIDVMNAEAKTFTTYTVDITVSASVDLRDVTLQRGETVTVFSRKDTGAAICFDSADVKALLSSVSEIAELVRQPDGKVGVVGKMGGSTDVMIVKAGQSYACSVTVEALLSGSYKAGAYEVAVTNASEVKYVDGDLVISYLNTNATVTKSFTLPKETTARLLAVGGGGAGGQDASYSTSSGLPGGGGAGGMVTNSQDFVAAHYEVTVGAGGLARRSLTAGPGANGGDTIVMRGSTPLVTAKGGGGGGQRSKNNGVGNSGGCGGGGSYCSSTGRSGGSSTQLSPGIGSSGGWGGHAKYGAGGGGAGGGGTPCNTSSSSSGAGGPGLVCDITGAHVEYARGGAGGTARPNSYYYYDGVYGVGVKHPTKDRTVSGKNVYLWEAEDGKPGRSGYGDGGGGGGHYGLGGDKDTASTYAGSGGSGVVVVRIPPYKTSVVDALKAAFAGQPAIVSGTVVTLTGSVEGPIRIPDNVGEVSVNLNGHDIVGASGAAGDDITAGGDGEPALVIVSHAYDCEADAATKVSVTGTGTLQGGAGGTGHPAGHGAVALEGDSSSYDIGGTVTCEKGADGAFIAQHPHVWAYTIEDGRIVATCVADDGVECSYRTRKPFVAISASDAAYTSFRYDQLSAVNGITPVTGIVVSPETYVGRDGTDYPESSTPPSEQGAYTVKMNLDGLVISSDFYITEPKPSQDRVYQSWKSAERRGRDVRIYLSATFDGSKTINDGNILLLGSRCNAHSMATGTVEKSINALTKYANVRWYAYGSRDSSNNLTNQLTSKGETVAFKESGGKVTDETVHLEGGNHFVHKEMMDDLYAELVEKRNRDDGYDLLILEFDGDLLGRHGESPYQLVYSLPEGWTDEKAALLRQAMSRYYAEDRVVWIVPDVNKKKSDSGWTGEYPWTSNPEFVWQQAFLNASESEGYKNPLQKNYEDADELVGYLQEVLVGHFFSTAVIKDTLADGLKLKSVTPQMRGSNGIWNDFGGGPVDYSIHEPRSDTMVTAEIVTEGTQKVTATFDMRAEQVWACANNVVLGDDFRLVIDAELDGFFSSGTGGGEEQETNKGPATFIFSESNLEGEEHYSITNTCVSPTIRNVKLTPVYSAEDVVKTYDGIGTNIVVKPVDPAPSEAVVRYSLDELGAYVNTLSLTEVCDKTKVWFEIVDTKGDFNTITNFATVTILPAPIKKQTGVTSTPYSAPYDGAGHTISVDPDGGTVSYLVDGAWTSEPPLYTNRVEATNVVFRVTKEGYDDFEGTNTVTVTRREATLESGSQTFPYDGNPHAYTNLTVAGFVEGEGLATTSDWATVVNVSEGQVDNTFSYTLKPNTLADNYEITVAEGKVAVEPAPVVPKDPSDPAENPDDEPQPGEGPTLWAENVVKMYDGVGTNVLPQVYGAVDGNGFTYEYTTNDDLTGWTSDLAFTNVVESQKVYFRAVPEGTDPNYVGATAFAYVTVLPRPVTVSFTAADKVYDGNAVATCTSTNFENLVAGEGFALDTSAMTFAFGTPDVGADKTVTATGYADALVVPLGGTLASNYAFAFVPTTTASITHARQTVTSAPYSGVYDGAGHTIAVDPDGGAVAYLVDGGWTSEPPLYTNRVEATNVVFRVTKDNYEMFEGTNTVTVTRREATLTSGTKTDFPYDGTPHAFTNLAVSGFVAGEGLASTSGWATVTAVAEGEVANTFAYALKPNTLADNYAVTVVTGMVAVVPAPVSPKSPSAPDENPGDEPQPGDGPTLWARNVVKTYDGVGTNVLAGVYDAVGGNGFAYEYSTDEVVWTTDLAFTNVVESQKVYFRALPEGTDPNYVGATAFAYVTVLPRAVTVSFTAADKVYDGTVAATCTATNFANVVEGEGFALDTSAMAFAFGTPDVGADKTVTATGYDDALLVPLGGTLASNYAFTFVETTTASITNAKQTGVTSVPYSGPYDGAGHTIAVDPDGGTVSYLVEGAWTSEPPLYTNRVEATNVVFRVTKAGYDDFVGTNAVTVTRRAATLTSGTKTDFPYDGTPHAFTNLAVSGFVAGEGLASTSGWATVVNVSEGEVANAFSYALKPNTLADNYAVTVVTGKVAVVPAPVSPKNPATPDENPDDEPQPGDGVVLWARNVVKTYDGVGTNVLAGVFNAVGGNGFAYEYSTDEVVWTTDLAFTNVVSEQKVYFRAVPEGTDPNYVGATAFAYVTVLPRPVTVSFTAADKVYDGTVAATCTATNFANVVSGEGFALDTSAMAFAFGTPDVGADKTVTATGYDDALVVPLGGTLASNYAFAFVPTTTASITNAKQTGVTSTPYSAPYDGAGHTISVDPDGGTVSYLVDGAWGPEPPLYTNRVEATNVVFRVTKAGYDDFEGTNAVTVTRREATLTSGTKTDFPYDGTPHAFTNLAVSGFVAGEGLASTSGWATVTDVSEGEVANAFSYALKPNTLADNYAVTVVTGKVAVVPAPVSPKSPATPDENPDDEPQPGEGPTLWAENVVKMYDGVGTNVMPQVYGAVDGNGFAYEYSVDETDWTDSLAFTNVTEGAQKVYFRAVPEGTDPNYVGATAFAYVTVLPRPVTVSFTAADKVYDGTVAATCTATNFANVVSGEGFALDTSAMAFAFGTPDVGADKTVTATGYDDALVVPLGGTLASNYAFAFVPTTTASITNATLAVASSDVTECYDGTTHTLSDYVVTDLRTGEPVAPAAISNSADGVTWYPKDDFPLYVNVTNEAPVYVAIVAAGYETFVSGGALARVTVTQRVVTVTLNETNKTYGAATPDWTVKDVDGLVGTDALSGVPGAIVGDEPTDVLGSPHAVTVGPGTLSAGDNYVIVVKPAKLTVDPAPITASADDVVKEYDGIPTNIVVMVTDPTGVDLVLEYSYDRETWFAEDDFPGYVNPTNETPVWFAVTDPAGNYLPVTNSASVTIRKVQEEVHGDPDDVVPSEETDEVLEEIAKDKRDEGFYYKAQLSVVKTETLDETTWTTPEEAANRSEAIVQKAESDKRTSVSGAKFVEVVLEGTDDPDIANGGSCNNKNIGWKNLSESNTMLIPVRIPFVTPADKAILGVYRASDAPDEITEDPNADGEYYEYDGVVLTVWAKRVALCGILLANKSAMLRATLDWAYNNGTGQYVAQLKIACTNGIENLDATDIKFAFEDRLEGGKPYATLKKWKADGDGKCRKSEDADTELFGGTTFRTCVIDAGSSKIKAAGLNNEVCFGPASTSGSVVQMTDRVAGYPCLFVADRLRPTKANETDVKRFLGYVLWSASGRRYALPVTAGGSPLDAVDWPLPLATPVSLARMNLCLSLGVRATASGDLSCAVGEFSVTGNRISGRIDTNNGTSGGVPSSAATVVLYGTQDLGGPFERLGELDCAAGGRFDAEVPEKYHYFKVGIEPGVVVK